MRFSKDCLKIDTQRTVEELTKVIRRQVHKHLRKAGVVLGISGGIDSSVCAALCVRALGPERVLGTIMPETDSDPESEALAHSLAESFNFSTVTENISDSLAAAGCYKRRDEAIKTVFPDYNDDFKSKITLPTTILDKDTFNFFQLTVESPSGETMTKRMPVQAYLQVVAASNLKQRLRMATSYYHAERRNYAVVGTGNKDEHLQGFFVKYGDGGADLKPIAHLFKVQVYQLAEYLGIPKSIIERTPTTDTYSASVTQEEFFFGLDFHTMDMLWHAEELGVPASEAAVVMNLTEEQVKRCYANIKRKITATEYLRMPPLVVCGAQETERHTVCDEQSERQTNNYS